VIRTVAGAGEPQAVKDQCDYVCQGGATDVDRINAAMADVGQETIGKGTNGGTVLLRGRSFDQAGPLLLQTQVALLAAEPSQGTGLHAVTSANWTGEECGMLQLATLNTQYATVKGLTFYGHGKNTSGLFIDVGTAQEWDAQINVVDVKIEGVGQDGVYMKNESGGRLRGSDLTRITVIDAGLYGFRINCPDITVLQCESGSSGSHGFYLPHSNGKYALCKSWYSQGNGFEVTGGRDNSFASCEAQDNKGHGWNLQSARSGLGACSADSNGKSGNPGTVTGSGFRVAGNGTSMGGCTASEKNEGGRTTATGSSYGWQEYGVLIAGSPAGCVLGVTGSGNRSGMLSGTATGSVVNVAGY
jgi:hypothetical protein